MKKRPTTSKIIPAAPRPEPTATELIHDARRHIEWQLEYQLERCMEVKTAFLTAAAKNDPADLDLGYLIGRNAEDVFIACTKEHELRQLAACFKRYVDSQDGGVQFLLDLLRKEKSEQERRLLESPFRHNSTCAMSNFQQECELRAKADFWHGGGFGRSAVGTIMQRLEEWLAAEEEVLNAYRAHSL